MRRSDKNELTLSVSLSGASGSMRIDLEWDWGASEQREVPSEWASNLLMSWGLLLAWAADKAAQSDLVALLTFMF